jgi:RHS repeat-associated protein
MRGPISLTKPAICAANSLFSRSHYTGKERDTESGNDYFGARYYSSSVGRFLSPDWSAKVEPVPYAKIDDPQSLNLYAYVLNNPLSRVDADGHDGVVDWMRRIAQGGGEQVSSLETNAFAQDLNSAPEHIDPKDAKDQSLLPGWVKAGGPIDILKKALDLYDSFSEAKEAKKEYDYWTKMERWHLRRLTRDMNSSRYADPMHIQVDHAQISLDEAERGYYGAKGLLTVGGATGQIMLPQLGDGFLWQKKMQVDDAAEKLDLETSYYNYTMNAH